MAKTSWTFYKSATITTPESKEETYQSQVYQIGIYVIFNNNSSMQATFSPAQMEKMCKTMQKDLEKGIIKEIKWGPEVTVKKVDSFWKEV